MERVVAVAQGCEALAIAGLSYREIRRAIQMSPSALDALIDGNHERALSLAKNVLPQQRRDVIAPVTGEWVEFPDTQDTAEGSEENPLMAVDGQGASDTTLRLHATENYIPFCQLTKSQNNS